MCSMGALELTPDERSAFLNVGLRLPILSLAAKRLKLCPSQSAHVPSGFLQSSAMAEMMSRGVGRERLSSRR